MSQLRLNPLTGRWVTIVAERAERPTDFAPRAHQIEADPSRACPFCPGNEDMSMPAALEVTYPDGSWAARIVPNLYPAFDGDEPFAVHNNGPVHVSADASGLHEVFVLTRQHDAPLHTLDDDLARRLMHLLKQRLQQHAEMPNVRYTQAIINHGREAGASLAHPHGQLLGLPFVPGELLEEQRAFTRFEGGCILCATIEAELVEGTRVVYVNDDVICIAPYWSGSPYELMIIPRSHDPHLTDSTDEVVGSVGVAIREALMAVRELLGDVSYNVVFRTAPHSYRGQFHWHVNVVPKLVTQAGFEMGTGVMINIVPPEHAAEQLRRTTVRA